MTFGDQLICISVLSYPNKSGTNHIPIPEGGKARLIWAVFDPRMSICGSANGISSDSLTTLPKPICLMAATPILRLKRTFLKVEEFRIS